MPKVYSLVVTTDGLKAASDMLRYDGCYRAERLPNGWRLYCTDYTPERWASFSVAPRSVGEMHVGMMQHNEFAHQATGFRAGLRLAQALLDHRLVEG